MTCLTPPANITKEPRLELLLLLCLIVLFAAAKPILFDTLDPDCFWHLRVAVQLRHDGIGPLVDHLSFSSIQNPWTPYSWLAELAMDSIWRNGGWRAAVLTQSITAGLFIAFIALACLSGIARKSQLVNHSHAGSAKVDVLTPSSSSISSNSSSQQLISRFAPTGLSCVVATAISAVLSLAYLSFRPVTFALVLLAMCGWLLVRDRRSGERTKAVWLLVPTTAIIINLHLYAVLLPMWVGALWIGAGLERDVPWQDKAEGHRRFVRYGWLTGATVAACLATPLLPGVIASALHYQYGDPMGAGGMIAEMRPFYSGVAGKISAVLVVLFTGFAFCHRSRLRMGDRLWFIVAGLLLVRLGRFAPSFAIVASPIFAVTMPRLSIRILQKPLICTLLALSFTAALIRVCVAFPRRGSTLSTWLNRHGPDIPGFPCEAADFVANNITPATHHLINEFTWGGYLEWRLSNYQTLLDGRTLLFTPDFWQSTYLGDEARRAAFLSTLRADAAVLPVSRSKFQDILLRQGWRVAYRDEQAQDF